MCVDITLPSRVNTKTEVFTFLPNVIRKVLSESIPNPKTKFYTCPNLK